LSDSILPRAGAGWDVSSNSNAIFLGVEFLGSWGSSAGFGNDDMKSTDSGIAIDESEGNLGETIVRLVGALIRHRWWFLLTAATIIIVTAVVLTVLPNRYTSEATIIVVQQSVPERYVVPTATLTLTEFLRP